MAGRTKILHVIDKFSMDGVNPSSCSKLFAEWIPLHDRDRFEVEVAGLRAKDPAAAFLEDRGIRVHYIDRGKISPKIIDDIARLAQDRAATVLHLHGYTSANFGRIAAKRLGIRSIMHEHAILKVQPHQFLADWLLRRKTDLAVAVSAAVKHFMMRGRSVPENRIRIIWNGISLSPLREIDAQTRTAERERFGYTPNTKLFGTVTRLREEKGNRYFLEAAAQISAAEPQARFLLIGDGPLKNELMAQAGELGIAERVQFAGFMADIPPLLAAMDYVVIPSLREGFGLALVEAMAAGRPVIASAVGGMPEIAVDGESALFVPPADGDAIAAAAGKLMQDEELAGRLADGAVRASEAFSIDKNVRALETLYAEMTNGNGSAAN